MDIKDIIEVIKTVGAILIPVVGGIVTYKIAKLNVKVDSYHTAVNGKMSELLTTTKQLGEKVGAERNQAKTDKEEAADEPKK